MNVLQKNEFKKAYKRLHDNQRSEVNAAIRKIISQPDIGESASGIQREDFEVWSERRAAS